MQSLRRAALSPHENHGRALADKQPVAPEK